MKVRDSGMPEQTYWESLFDVEGVLDEMGVGPQTGDVAELGCGYGTFTLPTALRINGTLHAFDIEAEMIALTRARAANAGVGNIRLELRDVVADGFGLPAASVDAVLLFNILHLENPLNLLRQAALIVRPGGRVVAIHWRSDLATPRGPALPVRPRPEQIAEWASAVGLAPAPARLLPPWHFGIALTKAA